MRLLLLGILLFISPIISAGQVNRCVPNRHQDWWNALHYTLSLEFDLENIHMNGHVEIMALATKPKQSVIQLDLQSPMEVSMVYYKKANSDYYIIDHVQTFDAVFITIPFIDLNVEDTFYLKVYYSGTPQLAKQAPWDGGLTVSMSQYQPWWGMSCQMNGASVFFPCKDLLGDEPELGARMLYTVPKNVQAIGNGKLNKISSMELYDTYEYTVNMPINLYNITFYIGDYAAIDSTIHRAYGDLEISWHYLKENEAKAITYFDMLPGMLDALEYWAGPYPFVKDGFKIVEAPYLGMEHQSAIAYGNGYAPGYMGKDRSGSGAGLLFDFILIHESAHEWFGNALSVNNVCDFWVHEGFTTYMESLYLEYMYGYEIAKKYRIGKQAIISNNGPAKGDCAACGKGNGDEYDKAAAMIHHLRMLMRDDDTFKSMLQGMIHSNKFQAIQGADIIAYMQEYYPFRIQSIFDQYLTQTSIPILSFTKNAEGEWFYKWTNCIDHFDQPIICTIGEKHHVLYPTTALQRWTLPIPPQAQYFSEEWLVQLSF